MLNFISICIPFTEQIGKHQRTNYTRLTSEMRFVAKCIYLFFHFHFLALFEILIKRTERRKYQEEI